MKRYEDVVNTMRHHGNAKLRYETSLYPKFPSQVTDYYIITKRLDRMDLIAYDYYGDETLWWIIQRANNLPMGTLMIEPGTRIRIPYPIDVFNLRERMKNAQY